MNNLFNINDWNIELTRDHLFGCEDGFQVRITNRKELLWVEPFAPEVHRFDREKDRGREIPVATTLPLELAQSLMDQLWREGMRPRKEVGTAGHLAATEKHLDHVTGILDRVLPVALRPVKEEV